MYRDNSQPYFNIFTIFINIRKYFVNIDIFLLFNYKKLQRNLLITAEWFLKHIMAACMRMRVSNLYLFSIFRIMLAQRYSPRVENSAGKCEKRRCSQQRMQPASHTPLLGKRWNFSMCHFPARLKLHLWIVKSSCSSRRSFADGDLIRIFGCAADTRIVKNMQPALPESLAGLHICFEICFCYII